MTKIEGNSIYLDNLKKPFRSFELVIAVDKGLEKTNDYDLENEADKEEQGFVKRMKQAGIEPAEEMQPAPPRQRKKNTLIYNQDFIN